MKEIPLTRGMVALVDDEDYERVSHWKWTTQTAPRTAYGKRMEMGRMIYLHRFIMGVSDGLLVDHIDRDGLNCQKYNMRICNNSQNLGNRIASSRNKSGYKGVSWDQSRGRWQVTIGVNYKSISVGRFDDLEEAARAYDAKARELHGEFARLNFP